MNSKNSEEGRIRQGFGFFPAVAQGERGAL